MLDYIARYTHRLALSNDRLLGCDQGQVHYRARDNETGGKRKGNLQADKFILRFLGYLLPTGCKPPIRRSSHAAISATS